MLNFSKINIFLIYLIFLFTSFFTILNFQNKTEPLIDKKVNLGLDLQGGSYLLLEINSDPLVKEKIQSKVIPLKKLLTIFLKSYCYLHKKVYKLFFYLFQTYFLILIFFLKSQH